MKDPKHTVVAVVPDVPARRLKAHPDIVSVRVEFADGFKGQFWIPFPTEQMAEAFCEFWKAQVA